MMSFGTYLGEGVKIEVVGTKEQDVFLYHMEGQGITSVSDSYRGPLENLFELLLRPLGLCVQAARIVPSAAETTEE